MATKVFDRSGCPLDDSRQRIILGKLQEKFVNDLDNPIPLNSVRSFLSKGLPIQYRLPRSSHLPFLLQQKRQGRVELVSKRYVKVCWQDPARVE